MQKSNHRKIEDIVSFIALFSKLPNRSSTIVCIRVQCNHPDLSGVPPGVRSGSGYSHFLGFSDDPESASLRSS